jgi:hypothetical protein
MDKTTGDPPLRVYFVTGQGRRGETNGGSGVDGAQLGEIQP